MPKVSKQSAAIVEDHGLVEDRHEDVDGYSINFLTFRETADAAPLLKGLPYDQCHCPHWGYVLNGRMTFRFDDHEEVIEAGDAFYLPPGHVPTAEAGTEYVQFSPSEQLSEVTATMVKNMQAMQAPTPERQRRGNTRIASWAAASSVPSSARKRT
ncbi:MAG: cupin domain-containing protein [Solirubrobacterales bacterium]